MAEAKKYSVCMLLEKDGKILSVSRKSGLGYGLVGGKKEPTDFSTRSAIRREALEEVGLIIGDIEMVFAAQCGEYLCYTYRVKGYSGEINTKEKHEIKWCTWQELFEGEFGEYNKLLYNSLNPLNNS